METEYQHLKNIFKNFKDPVLIFDPVQKNICYANPPTCKIFGFSGKKFSTKKITDVFDNRSEEVNGFFNSVNNKKTDLAKNLYLKTKSGKPVSCIVSGSLIENSQNGLILLSLSKIENGFGIETTEKHLSEKKLEEGRKVFFDMLDNLPIAFHLQAPDYTVPFANKMFRDRFGSPEKRNCFELMHNRTEPCQICPTFRVFDSNKNEVSKWTSNSGHTYLTVCTPFKDENENPLVMEMAMDITEQENAKKEALIEKRKAEQANNIKTDFLARMNHELRTPLNAILGFGQLLEIEAENLTTQQHNFVTHILKSGRHLLRLINNILDLTLIDAGNLELSPAHFSFDELIDEIILELKEIYSGNKVSFTLSEINSDIMLFADRPRLKQIISNALRNSIKIMEGDAQIKISCEPHKSKWVKIIIQDIRGNTLKERLEKHFQPLNQLGFSSKGSLGLDAEMTVCLHLIELMGGSIYFENRNDPSHALVLQILKENSIIPQNIALNKKSKTQKSLN